MARLIGIRREDKNQWERRAPLTPSQVERLIRESAIEVYVQPSALRVFPDDAYRDAGARVQEDLSPCRVILGVKEIPLHVFQKGKTYLFFSHTIKGQPYNMTMLKCMMDNGCQLIDYERIVNDQGRRLVLFGRHAGLAGMIESLHALGRRLSAEGVDDAANPFHRLKQPHQYRDLAEAKEHLGDIGDEIRRRGLPRNLVPLVVGFLGYGNVSRGAQEILDCLPVRELTPDMLLSPRRDEMSDRAFYKVVFEEKDTVEATDGSAFSLEHHWKHPEAYRAVFPRYLPHLTMLINGIYWDERFPVLVPAEAMKRLYSERRTPALRVIGDITCDIEGSIAITRKSTLADAPCYVYDTVDEIIHDGVDNLRGPVVMAVDNLPTGFPIESSADFGNALLPFIPDLASEDFDASFAHCRLPDPIKRAVILHHGKLTEAYRYLEKHVN